MENRPLTKAPTGGPHGASGALDPLAPSPKTMELLAPAGDPERLRYALHYGADAVYCGGKQLGLRSFAGNFTAEELAEGTALAHGMGRRVYVTVNAFLRNGDLPGLKSLLRELADCGADGLIVTDPATIEAAQDAAPHVELHLSTQANTTNSAAARFWHRLGVQRIVLARELSLKEIAEIRQDTPETLSLEAFCHGAMCVSYSGRCLLSNFLHGRDGNRGACVQPCRWEYELRERGKDGPWMPVEQDSRGTYLLNSRDLNMLAHLPAMEKAGIDCIKIEGRMKTAFYVAAITDAYRRALDLCAQGLPLPPALLAEPDKLRHRPYTTGFFFGGAATEQTEGSVYLQTREFVAVVLGYDPATGMALVEQRNRFFAGDPLELLSPGRPAELVRVLEIVNEAGESQPSAPHPCQRLRLLVEHKGPPLRPMDILRRLVANP